jgi:hypothetical protein
MRLVCLEPHDKYAELDKQQFVCGCGEMRIYSVLKANRPGESTEKGLLDPRPTTVT